MSSHCVKMNAMPIVLSYLLRQKRSAAKVNFNNISEFPQAKGKGDKQSKTAEGTSFFTLGAGEPRSAGTCDKSRYLN